MSVKKYNWPFSKNPHTLLVQEDESGKWSFAICDANSHIFITPGNTPEFIRLMPDKKIHKQLLVEENVAD